MNKKSDESNFEKDINTEAEISNYKNFKRQTIEAENKSESDLLNLPGGQTVPLTMQLLFCDIDFHLLTWTFVFAAAVGLFFVTNITIIATSLHLDKYKETLVIIVPVTTVILSVIIGLASDFLQEKISRMAMIVFAGTILCAFNVANIWTLGPAVMSYVI
ncbi:unnamed protein product [Mytilus coruscus]|uniref:Uncharacterized protein n=1 Tax=Mytilus coruscus TaxID=42192 RepID=A0A6J8A8J2_MYTCO|nr:unnamed protein product [Mytilus coruscus]